VVPPLATKSMPRVSPKLRGARRPARWACSSLGWPAKVHRAGWGRAAVRWGEAGTGSL
jgi:hypothetical protein